jgi:PAS domain-containing protein
MLTTIALITSILLQIIAFISALWLLKYARSRIAWILYTLKREEQEKDESEKRFSTLFHNSSDEIFLADLDGNF